MAGYSNFYYSKQGANYSVYGQDPNTGIYVQLDPNSNPIGNINSLGDQVTKVQGIKELPGGATTVPLGGTFNTGSGGLTNQGGSLVSGASGNMTYSSYGNFPGSTVPGASNYNASISGGSNTTPFTSFTNSSPFSSSSGVDIYSQAIGMLQGMTTSNSDIAKGQQSAITLAGQAASQNITADRMAADSSFQAQATKASQQGASALGMSDVQAALLNPTGTFGSPAGEGTGAYASTAYSGLKAQIGAQYEEVINQIKQAQATYDLQSDAKLTDVASQTMAQSLAAAQAALQNNMNIFGQIFGLMENKQNYDISLQNLGQQQSYYQAQIQQGQQSQAYQEANNIIAAIQSSGTITDAERQQLTQFGTQLGMPSLADIGAQAAKAGSVTMAQAQLDAAYKSAQIEKINSDLGGGVLKSGGLVIPKSQIGQYGSALINGATMNGQTFTGMSQNADGMVDPNLYTSLLSNWVQNNGLAQDFFKQFPTANYPLNLKDPSLPGWVKTMYQDAQKAAQLNGMIVPFGNAASTTGVNGSINYPG